MCSKSIINAENMCKLPKVNQNKKNKQNDLVHIGTLRNIDVAPHLHIKTSPYQDSTSFLSILLLHLGRVVGWVYQHRLKYRQVKIMKHARTGANYVMLTK